MNASHLRWPLVGLFSILALVLVTSAAFAAGIAPGSLSVPAAPQASGHAPSAVPPTFRSGEPTNGPSHGPAAEASEDATAGPSGEESGSHDVVFGSVTALGTGSVTVREMNGTIVVVDLTDSTMYLEGGATVTSDALVVGADILAKGTVSSGTLTAVSVRIVPDIVVGTVTSLAPDSLVVKTPAGKSVTIDVTGSTRFFVRGMTSATLADLAVGDRIAAFGTMGSDGALTAALVAAVDSSDHGFPGLGDFFGNGSGGDKGGQGGVSASHIPSPLPTPKI